MADVPVADAGLGSGIVNVSMQMASALGLAILSAIATGRTHALEAAGHSAAAALTDGYRLAFLVSALLVGGRHGGGDGPAPRGCRRSNSIPSPSVKWRSRTPASRWLRDGVSVRGRWSGPRSPVSRRRPTDDPVGPVSSTRRDGWRNATAAADRRTTT